jgi:hypothetical protein
MTEITSLSTAFADRYAVERELGRGGMATTKMSVPDLQAMSAWKRATVRAAYLTAPVQ